MNATRFIKICLIPVIGLFCGGNVSAQSNNTPDEPVLQSVSVDPNTGLVTIAWSPKTPPVSTLSTDGYIIYWLQGTSPSNYSNYAIDTVWNPAARSYTFNPATVSTMPAMPDPRKTPVPFTVATVHRTPLSVSIRSDADVNLQVSNKYDSCRAEIRLSWNPYDGWTTGSPPSLPLISYRVMQIPDDGSPAKEIKVLTDQNTSTPIPLVEENKQYTYYIEAVRSDGLKVTSYRTEKFTKMPIPPSYIRAESTQYIAQGTAEITFSLDPASETYSYEFLGSSKPDYSYVSLGTFNNVTGSQLVLEDIQTRGKTFYYKLSAWHVCKDKHTAESNPATALWLFLKQDDQLNSLQWDAYKDWGAGAVYELHRQVGSNPEEVVVALSDPTTTYVDDLSGVQIDGDVCYRVTAASASGGSAEQHATSNTVCIKPESDIFIPQAFIPNSTVTANQIFKPFFSYPPQEYAFFAYDRNGAKVFETRDLNEGWDGHLKNGKPANEGVYAYYIKFRTAKGRLVEKRGTFTLIYKQ